MGKRNRATIVEVEPSGLTWRKSSASAGASNACIELTSLRASVLIRNSRDRQGARLAVPALAWITLLATTRLDALER